jgi:hypothetical protein
MNKRIRSVKPPPLTPLRFEMLRDARDHGNALATLRHGRGTGLARAVRIMCELGYIEPGTGAITPKGLEVLQEAEQESARILQA